MVTSEKRDNSRTSDTDAFIVYYLNYPKTVELCMTLQNVVHTYSDVERTNEKKGSSTRASDAAVSVTLPFHAKGELSSSSGSVLTNSESYRVAETYEVKNTKSTYLKQLLRNAKSCELSEGCLAGIKEGELLRIEGATLSGLPGEEIQPQMQLLRHDALKGMRVEGIDVNNLISSMLEDYSYVLVAEVGASGNEAGMKNFLAVKIPTESRNEFESKYRMSDLLLGKVTLVGVYKGEVSVQKLLTNTFNDLQGLAKPSESGSRIFKSADDDMSSPAVQQTKPCGRFGGENTIDKVYYLDLISIIQPVCFSELDDEQCEVKRPSLFKRFFARLRGCSRD